MGRDTEGTAERHRSYGRPYSERLAAMLLIVLALFALVSGLALTGPAFDR